MFSTFHARIWVFYKNEFCLLPFPHTQEEASFYICKKGLVKARRTSSAQRCGHLWGDRRAWADLLARCPFTPHSLFPGKPTSSFRPLSPPPLPPSATLTPLSPSSRASRLLCFNSGNQSFCFIWIPLTSLQGMWRKEVQGKRQALKIVSLKETPAR